MVSMVAPSFSVVDLRERPKYAPFVADRVWRAWWKPKGHGLDPIEAFAQKCLQSDPVPSALVAHDGATFLGSALVIASDLDSRPQYTPWVAAVWVEPAHRRKGVGSKLVRAGAEMAKRSGSDQIYLCALPPEHGFYQRLGWHLIEANVTEAGLAVFRSS